jgi:phage tail-like protein
MKRASSYLDYLPAIFREAAPGDEVPFIGLFLLAFEQLLTGLPDEDEPEKRPTTGSKLSLEEKIDIIHQYFDPRMTDPEFLPWLSRWVALTLREDWTEAEKRRFIGQIVPLYRMRGTKQGLIRMLELYTEMRVEINEFTEGPLQVGMSAVGEDTTLGYRQPHYFFVRMHIGKPDPVDIERKKQIAVEIIQQEKPAHTYFDYEFVIPTLQIGVQSTIGVDTLLSQQGDSNG